MIASQWRGGARHLRAILRELRKGKAMLKIEFHVNETFVATIRKGREVTVDWAKLPPESRKYVMEYGMQRVLNDSVGAVKREEFKSEAEFLDACEATALKKLDALLAGEITTRGKASPRDELADEIRKMTIAFLRKIGKIERKASPDDVVATLKRWNEASDAKIVAKREAIANEASEIIAMRAKATEVEDFDF